MKTLQGHLRRLEQGFTLIEVLLRVIEEGIRGGTIPTASAEWLHKEYVTNEIAADEKYKGKLVHVVGMVEGRSTHPGDGTPYVTLNTSMSTSKVWCDFAKESAPTVRHGEKIHLVAMVGRKSGSSLILRNCILLDDFVW